jgi:hypothetical protein
VDPLKLLWNAERDVLASLLRILEGRPRAARADGDRAADTDLDMAWALAASHEVHSGLAALTQARDTARSSVRVAPRRMSMRAEVENEERRVARLDLLASATLDLMRTIVDLEARGAEPSAERSAEVHEIREVMRELASAQRPWSRRTVEQIGERMRELERRALPRGSPEDAIVALAARRVAQDILRMLPSQMPAPARV